MLKKRFGEEFATKIANNLEIKAAEVKKNNRDGKRKPRTDGKQGPRPDRKPRDEKKEEKTVPAVTATVEVQKPEAV